MKSDFTFSCIWACALALVFVVFSKHPPEPILIDKSITPYHYDHGSYNIYSLTWQRGDRVYVESVSEDAFNAAVIGE